MIMFKTPHIACTDTVLNIRTGKKAKVVLIDYLKQSARIIYKGGLFGHEVKLLDLAK